MWGDFCQKVGVFAKCESRLRLVWFVPALKGFGGCFCFGMGFAIVVYGKTCVALVEAESWRIEAGAEQDE